MTVLTIRNSAEFDVVAMFEVVLVSILHRVFWFPILLDQLQNYLAQNQNRFD